MAVDPTYPLFPVMSLLSAALLLLVLATNFIRQSWNFGVTALCIWMFLLNLTNGINSIIWSDNSDVKDMVYCDIVTHVQVFASIVRPACSLVITRRLYNIASGRTVDMEDMGRRAERIDRLIDIFLVLILPSIVTGAFYYVVQGARFQVVEGFGCEDTYNFDGVAIILLQSWQITLPLASVLFYIPKIVYRFYRLRRETKEFLDTNGVSRSFYYRILALGCLDILFTLPVGIANFVTNILESFETGSPIPFYWGWSFIHSKWSAFSSPYSELQSQGAWNLAGQYLPNWISVVFGFIVFALFGVTSEARAVYWRWIFRVTGVTPSQIWKSTEVSELAFGTREITSSDVTLEEGLSASTPVTIETIEKVLPSASSADSKE